MNRRRPKVLVVDDDEDNALLLHHVLFRDNERFDVLVARSVEVAQEILGETRVDVIVTDMWMPVQSGMDLLCWAAREHPDTRVILMTGSDLHSIRDRAHAFGCVRLMQKPFDFQVMRRAIVDALDRRDGFAGTLSELSCVDVVQMLCLSRKTTAILFAAPTASGAVYLDSGEIVHAVFGDLVGENALYAIMAVERGVFHTAPLPLDIERTITRSSPYLFLEGTRRLDEASRDAAGTEIELDEMEEVLEPEGAPAAVRAPSGPHAGSAGTGPSTASAPQ